MIRRLTIAGFALLSFNGVSAQGSFEICKSCERELDLDVARWQCLLRQRPFLEKEGTPVVFFQLNERSCNSAAGKDRSNLVVIPVTDGASAGQTSPVYVLNQAQLACLGSNAIKVQPDKNRVVFDFARLCP